MEVKENELVILRDVNVAYGDNLVLEHVDLTIMDDDFLGLIGPNGGGKTTLVKTILGGVKYRGEVVYGKQVQYGRHIGYLPQVNDFDTKFPITVTEVVLSGMQQSHGLSHSYNRQDKDKALALLSQMGIEHLKNRPIGQISGGQMQRALLCRALIAEPKLLILDEPSNFVDNKFEKELYELLHELNKTIAIVMVSHDLGTITSVVKNIVCVNKHVHRHESSKITPEQLLNYDCPIQLITHGNVPHTVLNNH